MRRAKRASPAQALLAWYDENARRLPWRVGPSDRARGEAPDPYRVWLSEVMLQQTTVAAVPRYFEAFLRRWPDVLALARADEAEVMKEWAGLGYYSRARNLKAAADILAREKGGRFPDTAGELQQLPGIGEYTAAAIAAIAFERREAVVDANAERVLARFFAVETPLPEAKAILRAHQASLTPEKRCGDYAQAVMDLGALICTPRRPSCGLCPWRESCLALASGDLERFPLKAARRERPLRQGAAFVALRADGAVLLRRRPPRGLLGGMSEVPGNGWSEAKDSDDSAQGAPFPAKWVSCERPVVHVFTHFRLELSVYRARLPMGFAAPADHWWSKAEELADEALPTVMKKAIEAALPGAVKARRRRAA